MSDIFTSVAALTDSLGPTVFRVVTIDRMTTTHQRVSRPDAIAANRVLIVSPHGGFIEKGTSAIAAATAQNCFNLFDFQGLRESDPADLHVTSTRFRHPELTKLLNSSAVALSIHGMGNQGHKTIWLGGLNTELKLVVLENLRLAGFSVNPDSPKYRGVSTRNFVNMTCHRGVQLELSDELMAELFHGVRFKAAKPVVTTHRFQALTRALRRSIRIWCRDHRSCGCNKQCCSRARAGAA